MERHITSFLLPLRQLCLAPPRTSQSTEPLSCCQRTHQEKQKGNEKASAESLNEILNYAVLALKTPSTQAKEAERLFTPTFQQLAFLQCAVMELLAPWEQMRRSPPGGSHSFLSRTLEMPMRCSQMPPQKYCKLGAKSVCSLPGRSESFPLVMPGSLH